MRDRPDRRPPFAFVSHQFIKEVNFALGQRQIRRCVWISRLSIVSQKILQLRMQNTDIRLTSRSAVRSCDSSALQPDFKILWNVSIFHRIAYQFTFSIASLRDCTSKVGDQFPFNLVPILWLTSLFSVNHRQS
jgi:hypothetical protein